MDPAQRAFLMEAMDDASRWTAHENSLLWKRRGERVRLGAADVLEAICAPILRCKRYDQPVGLNRVESVEIRISLVNSPPWVESVEIRI